MPAGRRIAGRVIAVIVPVALAVAACGGSGGRGAGTGIPRSGNPPTTAPTGDPAGRGEGGDAPAILDARPYAVGQRTETLIDTSRETRAVPGLDLAALPDRTIELIVLYPAQGEPVPAGGADLADEAGEAGEAGAAPVDGAPVAEGCFPVLVFAHGWTGTGASLVPNAQRWASAGYVVALPTFPLSKEGIGFGEDLPEQPADVRFVLDAVLGYGAGADDPLAGHVDAEHVAVGGHSLGSATAFAFLNTCCDDPRVDAVIGVSGGPLCCDGGEYPDTIPVPLLLVHGGRDTTVDHAASDFVFESFGGAIDYLFLPEADHVSFFRGDDHELFDRTVVAFLDAELGLDPDAQDGLADEITAGGRGTFRTHD